MANESSLTLLAQKKSEQELRTMSFNAQRWLKAKVKELQGSPSALAKEIKGETDRYRNPPLKTGVKRRTKAFIEGGLYFYAYDPKWKDAKTKDGKYVLPYYDIFPLVIPLEAKAGANGEAGFLGLNLHYLPLKYRLLFLDKLMPHAILTKEGDISRIKITSEISRIKYIKPCIKHYLIPHVRSKILQVEPNEWDIAVFLPVHQFKRKPASTVWKDSINKL